MTDIEIARNVKPQNIIKVAKKLGLKSKDIVTYGDYKAKICAPRGKKCGKVILVSAINPTKAGIGKTTVSIGLADGMSRLHKKVCLALREPSLGPVFGIKGGATGGGYSQVVPMEDINLHFNGDFHAITSANNLLCSLVDNHIFQGNYLDVDDKNIFIKRCVDLNDRALRDVELVSAGGRKENFYITAASEVMAVMCMAENLEDLKFRLGNIMVALNKKGEPLYARDFGAENSMAILLKEALMPNLVQTLRGTPAIVHLGPFANIAHGCNSVVATKFAQSVADYVITEAGFGADLGAEKFIDFKCRESGIVPSAVVLVATIKALKLHAGKSEAELEEEDVEAVKKGCENLLHHIDVIRNVYKLPVVVTINKYSTDTSREIDAIKSSVNEKVVVNNVWAEGGRGAEELAKEVINMCENVKHSLEYAYNLNSSVEDKINDIVKKVYGGNGAKFSDKALQAIENIKRLNLAQLPIIMAKTQFSLSADKKLYGKPKDFYVDVQDIEVRTGAGFLVALCGNMLLMPALGKTPAAAKMKIDKDGKIEGLF